MSAERRISLVDLCVLRAAAVEPSRLKAATLGGLQAAFIMEWSKMIEETGNADPTLEQWARWACVNERTAYRRLRDFRRLFGEWHDSPTEIVSQLRHDRTLPARSVPTAIAV